MTFRERLNKLDETGIGRQKVSPAEMKKIAKETGEFIRAHKETMKKSKKKKAA